jgi:hypothetical protein
MVAKGRRVEFSMFRMNLGATVLNRRNFMVGSAAFASAALAGCSKRLSGTAWRQKLSITAYTLDGEVTSSSVTEVALTGKKNLDESIRVTGEANVLDLGSGRQLITLLDMNHAYLVPRLFLGFEGDNQTKIPADINLEPLWDQGESRSVPFEMCPAMVSFVSVEDPMSVQRVDVTSLDSMFGVGFGIKSIEVEITDGDISMGPVASAVPDELFDAWSELAASEKGKAKGSLYQRSYLSKLSPEMFRRDKA